MTGKAQGHIVGWSLTKTRPKLIAKEGKSLRRFGVILLFLAAVAIFAGGIWGVGYRTALVQVSEQGRVYLQSASDRLVGQLARYRQVAVLTADHPDVINMARTGSVGDAVAPFLLKAADLTGALEVAFVDRSGEVLASATGDGLGEDLSQTLHFQRAMSGALGFRHTVLPSGGARIFSFMGPVFVDGRPMGAVLVRVDMESIEESDWRSAPQVVFFTDDAQKIFVTNRSELLHQAFSSAAGQGQFSAKAIRGRRGQVEWEMHGERFLPARALYLKLPQPIIGMEGHSLISTAPARRLAWLQSLVGAAVCLTFGAFLFLAMERRRTLAEANETLEHRVVARTAQLTDANVSLRHEIAERREAEEALRKAQADLVQAGKLSALGQMSAGISHELNQPLMAIRSFADNGLQFMERGRPDEAKGNLARIGDLSRRMARIIKNLRAFARQEHEPVMDVDIISVIDAVLELAEPRLHGDKIEVVRNTPDGPVWVRGGDVRLQQVVMNLVSNAADAMGHSEVKQLEISVTRKGPQVMVVVADSGPGLDAPDKIFDPFYTTKEVGGSEGMGLGLSISYGLVQSFGGKITGRNRDQRGAAFTVELTAVDVGKDA